MKKLLKTLFYDKEIVAAIQIAKPSRELLYTHLISGKITMKEYVAAQKAVK
jgi:hypothetical protein